MKVLLSTIAAGALAAILLQPAGASHVAPLAHGNPALFVGQK
ncbi:MAG: hypothetical protein NW216_13235 [Hyphomicrobium sp.]|nr:hypothetical protein [Hyphomicrobium sp.]